MPGLSDTLVFVPAWNEEESLPAVLEELGQELPQADVLVVDDGSTDRTAEIATLHGADVISFGANRGLPAGIAAGTARAQAVSIRVISFRIVVDPLVGGVGPYPADSNIGSHLRPAKQKSLERGTSISRAARPLLPRFWTKTYGRTPPLPARRGWR